MHATWIHYHPAGSKNLPYPLLVTRMPAEKAKFCLGTFLQRISHQNRSSCSCWDARIIACCSSRIQGHRPHEIYDDPKPQCPIQALQHCLLLALLCKIFSLLFKAFPEVQTLASNQFGLRLTESARATRLGAGTVPYASSATRPARVQAAGTGPKLVASSKRIKKTFCRNAVMHQQRLHCLNTSYAARSVHCTVVFN